MKKKANSLGQMDVGAALKGMGGQFQNLDTKDPSVWPLAPRIFLCIFIALGTLALAWFAYLQNFETDLQNVRNEETKLRQEFDTKLAKAVSLEGLKAQREQVQLYVTQLEKQLPSRSEMSALLSDINQAGVGRSLQFESFKPNAEVVRDYYAELPIDVRVAGSYHDIGSFVSDIAHLSRIVTLGNIAVTPTNNGLVMNTVVRTYRYLDASEVQAQKSAAKKGKK